MLTSQQTNIIKYFVICINDFAERFGMDSKSAYVFLKRFGGIEFLMQHYEAEHILSIDDALDDLEIICCQNGGIL